MSPILASLLFLGWTVVVSSITAGLFAWDKRAATNQQPRISESTLLAWSLAGGWPGGLVAGRLLRHKTRKVSFRAKFVIVAALHLAVVVVLAYLFWPT
ncbi:hypothetical protein Pla22_11040 [Rubripirellula amarantea]|uniref:DUF1294 domain-containing protein n=1 Tax=Rubripirellula amarantea TaxID=2527999 RepID=A0A5C5WTJ9_9BACT|nr:DUF1294 domain-containing protein [Rubripirellula amarantea]TWT53475.1 hypothetical protein Pla22_11040 [Rubripirellula amarantea]